MPDELQQKKYFWRNPWRRISGRMLRSFPKEGIRYSGKISDECQEKNVISIRRILELISFQTSSTYGENSTEVLPEEFTKILPEAFPEKLQKNCKIVPRVLWKNFWATPKELLEECFKKYL